jgi:antitoxin component YwqK of YwqJK toxin-antitoxin module
MKNLLLILSINLLLIAGVNLFSDDVYLQSGEAFYNVKKLQKLGDFFSFEVNGGSYSLSKNKISKITDSDNNIIFSFKQYIAEKKGDNPRSPDFVFKVNGKIIAEGTWKNAGEFVVNSGAPPDGVYSEFFDSGNLHQTFSFKNGLLNGECRVYFLSGKAEKEGFFKSGKAEGKSKLYYPDGSLKGVSEFKNGIRNGETFLYYKNGALKAKLFFKNGKPAGEQVMYYENGKPESLTVYDENGIKNGKVIFYFENGKIKKEGNFTNNELDGIVTFYYESGRVKKRRQFSHGKLIKEWKN